MSRRTHRRGFTIVYSTASLTLQVGFAAFCIDISRVRTAKAELQAAADAAALNGANGLSDNTYFSKAAAVAGENRCDGTAVTLAVADVTPGNWNNTAFTANGMPRNALRVIASRTKAGNNLVSTPFANALGLPSPDLRATSIVALVNQADYEWVGRESVSFSGGNAATRITAYDATNAGAAESETTIKSNGGITITGSSTINGDIRYGTNASVSGGTNLSGSVTQLPSTLQYPSGSQVANLNGVTPVFSATYDLTVTTSQTLPGGVYVVKNVNVINCNVTFTGPATIVCTGNLNMMNVGFTTSGNRPANLRIITTGTNSQINISNLTKTLYADFYAPDSTFNLSAADGYYGLRGRGVFKSMNASGPGASLWYDRSLTSSSLSRRPVLVK
jgi:hypothetical protein